MANLITSSLQQRNLLDAGAKAAIGEQSTAMLKLVQDAQTIRQNVTTDNVDEQLDWLRPHAERNTDTKQ